MPGSLGEFKIGLDLDLSNFAGTMNKASTDLSNSMKKMSGDTEKEGKKIENAFIKIGNSMSNLGTGMKKVGSEISMIGIPLGLAVGKFLDMGSQMAETQNLFDQSFKGMEATAGAAAKKIATDFGATTQSVQTDMALFNGFLVNMGNDTAASYKMSMELTKRSADLHSLYGKAMGLTREQVSLKIRSGLRGETEAVEAFGVNLLETNVKGYAYVHGLAAMGAELTEVQKQQARYGLILEQTAVAQGDFSRTQDSAANSVQRATARLTEATTQAATSFMPVFADLLNTVVIPLTNAFKNLMDWISQLPDPIKQVIIVLTLMLAVAGPVILVFGQIASAIGVLMPVLAGIGAFIAGTLVPNLGLMFTALGSLISPVNMVIVAVTLLWTAWQNNFGNIREHFNNFKKIIIDGFFQWFNGMKSVFTGIGKMFQGVLLMFKNPKAGWDMMIAGAKESGKGYVNAMTAPMVTSLKVFKETGDLLIDSAKDTSKNIEKAFAIKPKPVKPPVISAPAISVPHIDYSQYGVTPKKDTAAEKAEREAERAARDAAEAARIRADAVLAHGLNLLDIKRDAVEKAENDGVMSAEKAKNEIKRIETEKLNLKLAAIDRELKAKDLTQADIAKLESEKMALNDEFTRNYIANQNEIDAKTKALTDKLKGMWSGFYDELRTVGFGVSSSLAKNWTTGLMQMVNGTYVWRDLMKNIWSSLASSFMEAVTNMFKKWLEMEIAKRIQAKITHIVEMTQGQSTMQALGTVLSAAGTALMTAATTVGAAVMGMISTIGAAIMSIPGIGWVFGGLIVAGAVAGARKISAMKKEKVPSFDVGSMEIGQTGLATVHAGEMVIPSKSAKAFRESAATGGGGGLNLTFNISAIDGNSVRDVTENQIIPIIKKQIRLGNF